MAVRGQWRVHSWIYSPSMTANTPEDAALKIGVIDDVMTIINVEGVYFYLYLD
jgi:hypothetical protein